MLSKLEKYLGKYSFFETLKHTKNYFGSYLLVNALGVISLPVFTALLTTAEFGIVEVFSSMIKALIVLTTFNAHAAIGRYYYREKEDYKEFIGTTLLVIIGSLAISFLILFLARNVIFEWLNIPEETAYFIFPAVLAGVVFSIFNQLFVARKESMKIARATVMWSYGMFGFALLFIWYMDKDYLGKIAGNTTFMVITAIYMIILLWPHIKLSFSKEHLKYIFFIALPLLPHALSGFILHYLDQIIIISEEGQSEAGLYSFSYKIGLLLWGFNMALYNAALPDFFKMKNNAREVDIRQQEKSMVRFMVLAAGFLVLFAEDLGNLLASNKAFTVALHLVPIIVAGYLFMGFFNLFNRLIYHANKNIFISIVTIAAGVVNIILNFIFIPKYGYIAAAYTTLASYVFMFLFGWLVCRLVIKGERPNLLVMFAYMTSFAVVFALMLFINNLALGWWPSLLIKAFIFGVYGSLIFWNKLVGLVKDVFIKN